MSAMSDRLMIERVMSYTTDAGPARRGTPLPRPLPHKGGGMGEGRTASSAGLRLREAGWFGSGS
jgi:hypothetical protein